MRCVEYFIVTVMKNWHCTSIALVFPLNDHSRLTIRSSVYPNTFLEYREIPRHRIMRHLIPPMIGWSDYLTTDMESYAITKRVINFMKRTNWACNQDFTIKFSIVNSHNALQLIRLRGFFTCSICVVLVSNQTQSQTTKCSNRRRKLCFLRLVGLEIP